MHCDDKHMRITMPRCLAQSVFTVVASCREEGREDESEIAQHEEINIALSGTSE